MTTKELITKFVYGTTSGRASSVSIRYDKDNDISYLYSYSTIIAQFRQREGIVEINRNKYSVTTSRHQNWLLSEAKNSGLKIIQYEN